MQGHLLIKSEQKIGFQSKFSFPFFYTSCFRIIQIHANHHFNDKWCAIVAEWCFALFANTNFRNVLL